MTYIHQSPCWPTFTCNAEILLHDGNDIRHQSGGVPWKVEPSGFALYTKATPTMRTKHVVTSLVIEDVIENTLHAIRSYKVWLTPDRLFSWHAALSRTSGGGPRGITIGARRLPRAGPMRVVSGRYGLEQVPSEPSETGRPVADKVLFRVSHKIPAVVHPILKAFIGHSRFVAIHALPPCTNASGEMA